MSKRYQKKLPLFVSIPHAPAREAPVARVWRTAGSRPWRGTEATAAALSDPKGEGEGVWERGRVRVRGGGYSGMSFHNAFSE